MTCAVAGCGRPIVRGKFLTWVHATNPGPDHHYAKAKVAKENSNG